MEAQQVLTAGQAGLHLLLMMIAAPIVLVVLVVGLTVSIFQAVTQINEATLTFIPKMIVVGIVLVIAAPWMLDVMNHFTVELFEGISEMVRVK